MSSHPASGDGDAAALPPQETQHFPSASAPLLNPYLPPLSKPLTSKPHVTLTYAQSLDSLIASAPGTRTILSGSESKSMTHFLRSRHDAILVGVGTVLADDPGLNCRIEGVGVGGQPRPVVIDPQGRWHPSGNNKLINLARGGKAKGPWIVRPEIDLDAIPPKAAILVESAGGTYVGVKADQYGRFKWADIFSALAAKGVRSVMIEGGATVINDLLGSEENRALITSVIITIAPVWLGKGGVMVSPERQQHAPNAGRLKDVIWHQMGQDGVMCGQPATSPS